MLRTGMVITNNPLVLEQIGPCLAVEGGYLDVLIKVRDKVHQGYRLLTHPLAGSIKPNQTPYRSVIIGREPGAVDFESLRLIEGSIEVARRFLRNKSTQKWDDKICREFAQIDYYLLRSALETLD